MKALIPFCRVLFGAWMLANGINHFFFPLWTLPTGSEPLAIQLMSAFLNSGLFSVAMAIQLVAGALILAGILVPLALCTLMPISTCALYWAVVLDQQPAGALLAVLAFALNGLLMLAYFSYYRGTLQRHAVTLGEVPGGRMVYENLYVIPGGRTSRGEYVLAVITLLAVFAFYAFLVKGRTAQWCMVVLLFPAAILHARRLHDMGRTAWLLLAPLALLVVAFAIRVRLFSPGAQLEATLPLVAFGLAAAFILWGCLGKGEEATNRFGVYS
jgi:uncharacterized membrane protein YhaH (DUF805 family)